MERQNVPRIPDAQRPDPESDPLRSVRDRGWHQQHAVPGGRAGVQEVPHEPRPLREHALLVAHVRQRGAASVLLPVSLQYPIPEAQRPDPLCAVSDRRRHQQPAVPGVRVGAQEVYHEPRPLQEHLWPIYVTGELPRALIPPVKNPSQKADGVAMRSDADGMCAEKVTSNVPPDAARREIAVKHINIPFIRLYCNYNCSHASRVASHRRATASSLYVLRGFKKSYLWYLKLADFFISPWANKMCKCNFPVPFFVNSRKCVDHLMCQV